VLLSPGCHDPLYRKSLRVSCGHALRVPFARSESWDTDLGWLAADAGCTLLGMAGGGECTLQEAVARTAGPTPRRVVVVVGAEFAGLRPETLAACGLRVRIPMALGVDSLNVGVAAGVVLSRFAET